MGQLVNQEQRHLERGGDLRQQLVVKLEPDVPGAVFE